MSILLKAIEIGIKKVDTFAVVELLSRYGERMSN